MPSAIPYALCLLLFWSSLSLAEDERLALVVGNADYPDAPLNNALNDARDMAEALASLNFRVLLKENLDRLELLKALREFGAQLRPNSIGVFYYSGHAVQYQGRNYLLPAQTPVPDAASLDLQAVPANRILEETSIAGNLSNILIFDACRDNAFAREADDKTQGLAKMDAPPGTLIAYATAPGKVAQDAGGSRNSPYTQHLLHWITQPNLSVGQMFNRVRDAVIRDTQNQQVPSEVSFLREDFYFGGQVDEKTLAQQETQRLLDELREVEAAKRAESKQQRLQQYLQQCRHYEKSLYLVDAPADAPDAAALPCYQKLLEEYPNNAEALARLASLERRYRAWAEGALRQQQWQKAASYLQGLQKINPQATDLAELQQQLQELKQRNQQNQQLESLSEELLGSHLATDLELALPAHLAPPYWSTDSLSVELVAGQPFVYYLPLPAQPSWYVDKTVSIRLTTAKPDWLDFSPQQHKLSGVAPTQSLTQQEWVFLAQSETQTEDLLTLHVQFATQAPTILAIATPPSEPLSAVERTHLAFFQEIVVRCFQPFNYHVLLQPMHREQALYAMQAQRVQAAYPYPLGSSAFYYSAPLSQQVLWEKKLAHLLVSKVEMPPLIPLPDTKLNDSSQASQAFSPENNAGHLRAAALDLVYRFNRQLRRLQQSGQLHLIWTRYERLANT